jgi:hypothetical protein
MFLGTNFRNWKRKHPWTVQIQRIVLHAVSDQALDATAKVSELDSGDELTSARLRARTIDRIHEAEATG